MMKLTESTRASRDAVFEIDILDPSDPELAHNQADEILLSLVPEEVREAYKRLFHSFTWE